MSRFSESQNGFFHKRQSQHESTLCTRPLESLVWNLVYFFCCYAHYGDCTKGWQSNEDILDVSNIMVRSQSRGWSWRQYWIRYCIKWANFAMMQMCAPCISRSSQSERRIENIRKRRWASEHILLRSLISSSIFKSKQAFESHQIFIWDLNAISFYMSNKLIRITINKFPRKMISFIRFYYSYSTVSNINKNTNLKTECNKTVLYVITR